MITCDGNGDLLADGDELTVETVVSVKLLKLDNRKVAQIISFRVFIALVVTMMALGTPKKSNKIGHNNIKKKDVLPCLY